MKPDSRNKRILYKSRFGILLEFEVSRLIVEYREFYEFQGFLKNESLE
jgi:hypothetical protein